ncbi:apolipoprotein N-acyltransferase [Pseudoduganella lurida]|uniref:Apolipoprotein N-acyltransferase n=1 Tax=Pseudoduganella lurida TaxID=1036180 RepID=A0A562QYM1_9BURK|nr:nitrilase-related carbon-nitrogen hydrolase [Pseudoduganella lurida]TWI61902.1 apolipoprotein N-acyltransferase [Pseudoduganella lurida]
MRHHATHFGIDLALALAGGIAMRHAFGLDPVWWLAWLAPAPVLVAALRSGPWRAFLLTLLAGLVASSASFHYFTLAMPLPVAVLVTVLLALTWALVVGLARRVLLRVASPWAVLAYPLLWCAVDTLMAHLHPDGNWSSLAYSQAQFLPAVQVLALAGTAGLVFVLSLLPATIALAVQRGWQAARTPLLLALVLTVATFAYGFARIPSTAPPQGDLVGLAVIDDYLGPRVPPSLGQQVWTQYEAHVAALAGQGARIVVLPEKIDTLTPAAAQALQARLAALAARHGVWLAAGIGVDDDGSKRNLAWLMTPDGHLDANYQKHHIAPPEREFLPGAEYAVRVAASARYGLAICKDLHFAAMGRAYGTRQVQALLVPAWDFDEDGLYAARLSALRGVESGFAMVRAARQGLLTVTDPYGRIVAETPSAGLPGTTLLARVPAQHVATLYARTGDLFGWLCTAAAALLLVLAFGPRGARAVPREAAATVA